MVFAPTTVAISAPKPDLYATNGDEAQVEFSVALSDPIDGGNVVDGTKVKCTLKTDVDVDERTIAPAGSTVIAHVEVPVNKNGSRTDSRTGKLHLRHALILHFDRIITPSKEEVDIDGIPLPQNAIFNNGGTFRELVAGSHGELIGAKDIDIADVNEVGLAVPKEYLDRKSYFNVNLKEGDEIKVLANVNPSVNLSGKIMMKPTAPKQIDR